MAEQIAGNPFLHFHQRADFVDYRMRRHDRERNPPYGPMKPVGLVDPRTGRRPFAVVQLRHEDKRGVLYNLVGFQTKLRIGEQKRVFRGLPGLADAVFARFGSGHRNTYINAPRRLTPTLEARARPGLFITGQMAGVEGYVESAALGWLLFYAIRPVVSSYLVVSAEIKERQLTKEQQELVEEWGAEVRATAEQNVGEPEEGDGAMTAPAMQAETQAAFGFAQRAYEAYFGEG